LTKDFWHERWEKDEIAFHMKEVNPMLIKHFSKLALKIQKRIFIPLCGKTLDIQWLLSKDYKVVGIELNEDAIKDLFLELDLDATIKNIGNFKIYHAENIEILLGDFFELSKELLGNIDFIYDRAALVALPKDMRRLYVEHLLNITNKVPQLLISYEYNQNVMKGPPFSVDFNEIDDYYSGIYTVKLIDNNENIPSGLKRKSKANEKVWLLKNK
jgi:thiopurine S-methyltransferase